MNTEPLSQLARHRHSRSVMRASLQVIASPPRIGRGVIIENQAGWRHYLAPSRNA